MSDKKKEVAFKVAFSRLEKAVRTLEEGELDLEKSVDIFCEGMRSAAICQRKLNEAEKKVEIVVREFGNVKKEELQLFDETDLLSEE